MSGLCGYTVIGAGGHEGPCDQLATGWRWYQGAGHEDALDVACEQHANEGGRRMAALQALVNELRMELAEVEALAAAEHDRLYERKETYHKQWMTTAGQLNRAAALVPEECWVLRATGDEVASCTSLIGGVLPSGSAWTEEMCCLPCRLRAALRSE